MVGFGGKGRGAHSSSPIDHRSLLALPPAFAKWAVVPERPLELQPDEIGRNRDRWIREWTDVVLR